MKNNVKRVAALAIALVFCLSLCAFGAENTFSLRIEGCWETFYSGDVQLPEDGILWTALKAVMDENSISYTVSESGTDVFISSIGGEATGMFEWLDGWMYMVNGVSPSDYISSYKINAGDEVVVYYGDMLDTVEPIITVSPAVPKAGDDVTLTVSGKYDILDNNWNVIGNRLDPIEGAVITFDGQELLTDENGQAVIAGITRGIHKYYVSKDDPDAYPDLIRTGELTLTAGNGLPVYIEETPVEGGVSLDFYPCEGITQVTVAYTVMNGRTPVSCTVKAVDISGGYSEIISLPEGCEVKCTVLSGVTAGQPLIGGNIGTAIGCNNI